MWFDASLSHTPTCQSSIFINVIGCLSCPHTHLSIIHLSQCDWMPLFPNVNHPSFSMWLEASLSHMSIINLSQCDCPPVNHPSFSMWLDASLSHTPTCQSSIFINVIGRLSFPHTHLSIIHLYQCDWTPLFPTQPPVNHPSLSMWLDASLFPHAHLSIIHLFQYNWGSSFLRMIRRRSVVE